MSRLPIIPIVLPLLGWAPSLTAQAAVPADSGTLVLYKWQNPVGKETYRADAGVAGRSYVDSFAFGDRGQVRGEGKQARALSPRDRT